VAFARESRTFARGEILELLSNLLLGFGVALSWNNMLY